MLNIEETLEGLNAGTFSSEELVRDCIAKAKDTSGQGNLVFTKLYEHEAVVQARAADLLRSTKAPAPVFSGIPITIKDLFDVAGSVTTAGSTVLKNENAAKQNAPAVDRLVDAGFIIIGRTNMTEFAYSGLGMNPHYGTPANPYDRETCRIPGGSSSGAAVAITDGFAAASLGSDTGGSCRIPAALCGIVGFKPTAKRIPMEGTVPLSPSLDSVGALAASVASCAAMDAVLSGNSSIGLDTIALDGLRLGVPQNFVLNGLDRYVEGTFDRAVRRLERCGVKVVPVHLPELDGIPHMNRLGGFAAAEAYAWHRERLSSVEDAYDPLVSSRIRKGADQSAADYIELLEARRVLIRDIHIKSRRFDALVCPTVPTIAPSIAALADESAYHETNLLMLRNPSVANLLDRCSISLPCHDPADAPAGLMLIGEHGTDRDLLSLAASIAPIIAPGC